MNLLNAIDNFYNDFRGFARNNPVPARFMALPIAVCEGVKHAAIDTYLVVPLAVHVFALATFARNPPLGQNRLNEIKSYSFRAVRLAAESPILQVRLVTQVFFQILKDPTARFNTVSLVIHTSVPSGDSTDESNVSPEGDEL